MNYPVEHIGDYGDFQIHTGPRSEGNEFYSGGDDETEVYSRPVTSVRTPVKGQWVCKTEL